LEVNILGDLVELDIGNGVGFTFGDTEHATGNARVDVNALPARIHERQGVWFRWARDGRGGYPREIPPLARPRCAEL
jgi:hypothetical protein